MPTEADFKTRLDRLLRRARQESITATLILLQLENFYEIRTWVGKSEASLLLSDIAREFKKALPHLLFSAAVSTSNSPRC